jgi:carboxymethylenebutenolidase
MKTAADFHPEVLRLFDKYVHGFIDRRAFLAGAAKYAVAGMSALALLEALSPKFAAAQQVAPSDARIQGEYVEIDSPQGYGKVRAYLVRPAKAEGSKRPGARSEPQASVVRLPTVLVIHENRGLNPHIEDIARRVALANFIALAPDALFPLGGYPGDEDKAREQFQKLDQAKTREDFVAAANYLRALPDASGKLGAVGFCYGGGMSNYLATRLPELSAAVPFYGGAAPLDKVGEIKAELLIHFAEKDERIAAGWPAYETALKAAGVRYEAHTYPGTQHGFNNDTTPRYDQAAAKLAWDRTMAFFERRLRA